MIPPTPPGPDPPTPTTGDVDTIEIHVTNNSGSSAHLTSFWLTDASNNVIRSYEMDITLTNGTTTSFSWTSVHSEFNLPVTLDIGSVYTVGVSYGYPGPTKVSFTYSGGSVIDKDLVLQ